MSDVVDENRPAGLSALEGSETLTRRALLGLFSGPAPEMVAVAGRDVHITTARDPDEASFLCTWEGGSCHLTARLAKTSMKRAGADSDARLGLAVYANSVETIWRCFEWVVRDAIRAGHRVAVLHSTSTYRSRPNEEALPQDVRGYSLRTRELLLEANVPVIESGRAELARLDLVDGRWSPTGAEPLRRLIVTALIKAHVFDRDGRGAIQGVPLFRIDEGRMQPISGADTNEHVAAPQRAERLAGIPAMVGQLDQHFTSFLGFLRQVQEESPTEAAFVAWMCAEHEISEFRATTHLKLLKKSGLVNETDGTLTLSEQGLRLLESSDGTYLFEVLRSTYLWFDEILTLIAARERSSISDIQSRLNEAYGVGWQTTTQLRARVYWLFACGLVELHGGRPSITQAGRRLLPSLVSVPEAQPATVDHPDDTDAEPSAGPVRLESQAIDTGDLMLPRGVIERCCAALTSGKHLLLIGPPGTGKSTLGEILARHAADRGFCDEPLLATASADWTTYDTIGGWAQRADGTLAFREGVVTRALADRKWVVLDEVNRADIDRCFGELFTVLAGGTATTPYTRIVDGRELPVEIGPSAERYTFGPWFRLICTMNIRDKASLFRLSYAFLRRFAVITVPCIDDVALRKLAARECDRRGCESALGHALARALSVEHGLAAFAPLGPSILRDAIAYADSRGGDPVRAVAEAIELLVLPQLEGMGESNALDAYARLGSLLASDVEGLQETRAAFRAAFPHVGFS